MSARITNVTGLFKRYWAPDIGITATDSDKYPWYNKTEYQELFGMIRCITLSPVLMNDLNHRDVFAFFVPPIHSVIYEVFLQAASQTALPTRLGLYLYPVRLNETTWSNTDAIEMTHKDLDMSIPYNSVAMATGDFNALSFKVPNENCMIGLYNRDSEPVPAGSKLYFNLLFSGLN